MGGRIKRAVIIVFDGFGVGELPDAAAYHDEGSDTLDNVSKAVNGLKIPNLINMGLGLIEGVDNVEKTSRPTASWGRMKEASPGKDTQTGHWEMSGVILERPYPTFPGGFPPEILRRFEKETGWKCIGGKPASGTGIIDELGAEHMRTKKLIVYTSADSVFQIAAHEDIVPIEELYRICETARRVLDDYNIGRVIARPFIGSPGTFKRTGRRRDYPQPPPGRTLLEELHDRNLPVIGIGKIGDIFVHRGLTEETHTKDDADGMDKTMAALRKYNEGLIFTNLVDFDTQYGHRNDPKGYAGDLERMDSMLPGVMGMLGEGDVFFLTADHGCDPTTPSTDHSREYVPLLVYGKGLKSGVDLGTRDTFADLGATIAEAFGFSLRRGRSFLKEVIK